MLRAAIEAGNLNWLRKHARALAPIRLHDALHICLVVRDQEPERYEAAAVRWLGRFALEVPTASLEDLATAASALELLPTDPLQAMEALGDLEPAGTNWWGGKG